jgi:UDP-glucose 4-epimerase
MGLEKTALVTGASGVIGPVLIHQLLDKGYSVNALDLIPPEGKGLPKEVAFYACNLADRVGLRKGLAGSATVFHLAAKLHVTDPCPRDKEAYWTVNVQGTKNLIEAAGNAGVQRIILFSTINVYGSSESGIVYDENSRTLPDSWYAESKIEAEGVVINSFPSVVLRLAAVYGPRMKGNYIRLLEALQRGRFVMVGNGQNRRTLVHLQDACDAAILAAEHPDAVGHIYNVTDGRIHTFREVIAAICGALGREVPTFSLPVSLIRPVFGLTEDALHLLGRKSPVGRSTVDKLIEDLAVSGDRIQRELGFRPRFDLASGWKEVVKQSCT